MQKQNGSAPVVTILIVIVILIMTVFAWYFLSKNSVSQPLPTPQKVTEKTPLSQNTNSAPTQQLSEPTTQVTTKQISHCGKKLTEDVIMIGGKDAIDMILQLSIANDKNNCINFEQFTHISALQQPTDSGTLITLYENSALSDSDKKLPLNKQGQIISEKSPTIMFHVKSDGSIYPISVMDGSEEPSIGTLK